ncbi:hypothetical protein SAMN06296427_10938 [Moheibacter sediminis]|uniref:Uncharacterized protein n=1 Tax=Moheibacter sediminis TaxID=1434700 RepID=A0A1W2C7G3_9FLAO|nr:hypothetical protein SAMN06296427_10938 [Moheibacter sediminis]
MQSLISQCDYRLEPKGFWNENGRYVLSLYKILM